MSIRLRVLLAFVLIAAGGVFALVRVFAKDLWPYTQQAAEESLVETAGVLASLVETQSQAGGLQLDELRAALDSARGRRPDARIYTLPKDSIDLRVYVTDEHGIVRYDSDAGRDEGRDYSRWNDVRLTMEGRYGARATRSSPVDPFSSVLYVAAPIRRQGRTIGVLSVGKPMRGLEPSVGRMYRRLSWIGLALIGGSVLLSLGLAAWITLPIERLTSYARAIGQGRRPLLPKLGTPEAATLGEAMESMREALEGKRYIEGYVRSLTHEIKAPLSAIRASAELLDEDMAPADRRRFLANIRGEALRLQALIDRMLELAALEARQRLEKAERVELAGVAAEVIESLAAVAAQRRVALTSGVSEGLFVDGDRFLIRQALANLVQNALAATPAGGCVRLSSPSDQERITLTVDDTGPGVPEYALPRLFERFYSVRVGEEREGGTGLGLPFVREVALLHGGCAAVENLPGRGARATLRLPRSPARTKLEP